MPHAIPTLLWVSAFEPAIMKPVLKLPQEQSAELWVVGVRLPLAGAATVMEWAVEMDCFLGPVVLPVCAALLAAAVAMAIVTLVNGRAALFEREVWKRPPAPMKPWAVAALPRAAVAAVQVRGPVSLRGPTRRGRRKWGRGWFVRCLPTDIQWTGRNADTRLL